MRQYGENGFTPRALDAPNGETTEPDTGVMRVAGQTDAFTGGFVCELKTQGEDESQDELDECFAIAEQLKVGRLIVEIDGDRAVLSGRFGGLGHVSSPCGWQPVWIRHREDKALKDQADCEGIGASPLNPMECEQPFPSALEALAG